MTDSLKKEVRTVKYKNGEFDFFEKVNLKEMLEELSPKHDQLIEIILRKK